MERANIPLKYIEYFEKNPDRIGQKLRENDLLLQIKQ